MVSSKFHSALRFVCLWPVILGLLFALPASLAQAQAPLRVAMVGLQHDHVMAFLNGLPQHHDVELVGIAEADPALVAKYEQKFGLAETLFFKSEDKMIEE